MHRTTVAGALAVAMVVAAACSFGGGGAPGQPAEPGVPQEGGDGPAESAVATPEAELEGRCEPLPRQDQTGPYVTADLVVRNTGNIGVAVRVVANWRQPGGRNLTRSRRLRLDVDEREDVSLRIDIQPREARAIRRMVRRDRPCYTRVRVVGAFGEPRQ